MKMFAIIERELRKFFRSPTLMLVADGLPAGAADRAGQRVRRKDPRRPAWDWSTRITARRQCA